MPQSAVFSNTTAVILLAIPATTQACACQPAGRETDPVLMPQLDQQLNQPAAPPAPDTHQCRRQDRRHPAPPPAHHIRWVHTSQHSGQCIPIYSGAGELQVPASCTGRATGAGLDTRGLLVAPPWPAQALPGPDFSLTSAGSRVPSQVSLQNISIPQTGSHDEGRFGPTHLSQHFDCQLR